MLENEINFEFNNLEQKLLKLLEEYNQLKNKVKKLDDEKEDLIIQLSIKNHEFDSLKRNKILRGEDDKDEKIKLKKEIEKNINEIDNCIALFNQS